MRKPFFIYVEFNLISFIILPEHGIHAVPFFESTVSLHLLAQHHFSAYRPMDFKLVSIELPCWSHLLEIEMKSVLTNTTSYLNES